jgi:NAD(P)-dependent dehydrogenase (short-subunit alcohol dehydrogenase family)
MKKVAFVTGGAVRIGRAIALKLAASGFSVAIQYSNSKGKAEEFVSTIREAGGKAACFQAALNDDSQLSSLIPSVARSLGPVTCLINNAAHFKDDSLQTLTVDSWHAHMAVNLRAPVFLSQAFAAQLPEGTPGNIINITDQRVLRANPLFFSYALSKSALWAATKTMAQALAPRIRVNAIGPGPTLSSAYQSNDDFERECNSTLLGHGVSPEEIARAVLFILQTPAMTGQMIVLDGGQHLLWQTPDIGAT